VESDCPYPASFRDGILPSREKWYEHHATVVCQ
jgi:hypothetical protein